ncbi:ATP-binding cassette domain-containing protein [Ensifer sp. T173]|uniref:ATP-binding cassette domain-containing protein n=2 Tax=Sinorhizobium/Ensifer group TaxID=227292 RepID=A0AAW4FLJ0_9HYPH|nr:peptide ABC transporter ATP-binding protein [Ensifer sp. Root31]KQW56923.1 peptide ABC transporter ATP-binding protein [Ensifer sp. Root127]KQW60438.1 peptide ABC transporter ATP-binding protein [Ensifer sp. Root1252]KQY58065.1 peptide ABC transporter ATP-binding protein [Ensifer sp. Root142]KRC77733.1 peptide ABC transporter ATP-binding protein [Ensifer sp. Root231]KRC99576.1 peptide ABC transporter ATP-binding protein [Ensifer sp. Root258]MBM3091826.1 ATP-binding cassette domain-containi
MQEAATPLLSIRDLFMRFEKRRSLSDTLAGRPRQVVSALNGVDLDVMPAETLGIVGESGCGKSTLARCIAGLHRPTSGDIRFEGESVIDLKGARRRGYNKRVQMMFQDPYTSLNPRMTVRDTLREAITVHRMREGAGVDRRVDELLDLVRLPDGAADKYPHEFSGGQRQRIGIARALSLEPTCLVADELVSALDVSVQAQVVNLLLELQDNLGLTVLFVAHDLRLVRHVSHRVAVIYLGAIVEIGPSEALFSKPMHPYSQALLAAAPSLDPTERRRAPALSGELPSPLDIPPGCPFHVRCPHATELCRREKPALRPVGNGMTACHFAETIGGA